MHAYLITQNELSVRTVALYRPPLSAANNLKDSMFHEEFGNMIAANTNQNILIIGDFNFHWDEPTNVHTRRITQFFDSADLVQHVVDPTHSDGHILDWIVTRSDKKTIVRSVSVEDLLLSDHFLVCFTTNMASPIAQKKEIQARNFKAIDMLSFRNCLSMSDLVRLPPSHVDQLVLLYNQTLSSLLTKYAPMTNKLVINRPDTFWFTPSVRKAKLA